MRAFLKSFDRRALSGLPSVSIMHTATNAVPKPLRLLSFLVVLAALALPICAQQPHPGLPRAQKHEGRHEIDQLEEQWRAALLKSDAAEMDVLLADDYMAITPNGTLQTKEQWLANLRSGATHFTSIEISDRRVRFYGATALLTSRADVAGTNAGIDFTGSYRYTRVFVRNAQGQWKIVSFEASRIREPGQRK
ncbi:MAG: nuclear transport factor 2 family protein [Terracidiphilus sp.]